MWITGLGCVHTAVCNASPAGPQGSAHGNRCSITVGHRVQHMATAAVLLWATGFSTWQPLQYYCGPQGSADGSGNSIAVGHRVQQMAVATVLLWATGFSRWQWQHYLCGLHGSAAGNYCCGPHGSADGSGNSIAVGHRVQHMATATVFCGPQGSADGSGNIVAVGHMVQQMAVATLLYNQNVLMVTFELFVFQSYYLNHFTYHIVFLCISIDIQTLLIPMLLCVCPQNQLKFV